MSGAFIRTPPSDTLAGSDSVSEVTDTDNIMVASDGRERATRCAASIARGGKPLTVKRNAAQFGGYHLARSLDRKALTLYLTQHIEASTLKWLPSLSKEGIVPSGVPQGVALHRKLDSLKLCAGSGPLSKAQRQVQSIVGDLRWQLRVAVAITRHVHILSRVANRPDPQDAMAAALGVQALSYKHRNDGLTYGGCFGANLPLAGYLKGSMTSRRGQAIAKVDGRTLLNAGAPSDLLSAADTTWNLGSDGSDDVMCLILTHNGAALLTELKMIGIATSCSSESEGIGSVRVSDKAMQVRVALENFGRPQSGPTALMSDNESNLRVASGAPSAQRLRHSLRRWAILTQRLREREIFLAHCDGEHLVPDVFTKWVKQEKFDAAITFLTNVRSKVVHANV